MHKLVILLKRRADLTPEQFRAYYEERHAPLCMRYMVGVSHYVRRYIGPGPGMPDLPFDVITEVWIKDRAEFDMILDAMGKGILPDDVIADEEQLFDRAQSRFCAMLAEHETDIPGT